MTYEVLDQKGKQVWVGQDPNAAVEAAYAVHGYIVGHDESGRQWIVWQDGVVYLPTRS